MLSAEPRRSPHLVGAFCGDRGVARNKQGEAMAHASISSRDAMPARLAELRIPHVGRVVHMVHVFVVIR